MTFLELLGLLLALFIGISLGLIGSGGSIITVPILVYVLGVDPVLATAYSLFIVGATSLVGSVRNIFKKSVNFKAALFFGVPSIIAVFLTRSEIVPLLPDEITLANAVIISKGKLLMILFAMVMIAAASKMMKRSKINPELYNQTQIDIVPLALQGFLIGTLSGLVGAGGGFIIIPALVFYSHLSMRKAIGTSLTIISAQSLIGFFGDAAQREMDWLLLISFSGTAIIGLFIGLKWSGKLNDQKLKRIFSWFVLIMAVYILVREIAY